MRESESELELRGADWSVCMGWATHVKHHAHESMLLSLRLLVHGYLWTLLLYCVQVLLWPWVHIVHPGRVSIRHLQHRGVECVRLCVAIAVADWHHITQWKWKRKS